MDFDKILKIIKKNIEIEDKEEFLFHWVKENEKYIQFSGFLFHNKKILIPIGTVLVNNCDIIYTIDKEKEEMIECEIMEDMQSVDVPQKYQIPDYYDKRGLW